MRKDSQNLSLIWRNGWKEKVRENVKENEDMILLIPMGAFQELLAIWK